MSQELFSDYIRRVMKQKGLTARDVARNCNNKIDSSYVSKFTRGFGKSPSAKVIKALAEGLGVNPHDVFGAITGCQPDDTLSSTSQALELLAIMEQVVLDPDLMEVLRGLVRMPKEERALVLDLLKFSDELKQPALLRKVD
jgi:transcriptional regulator with XRE-family HTH domain